VSTFLKLTAYIIKTGIHFGLKQPFTMNAKPSYTTYTPPQRQTGTIKNRKPAAAGRFRFFRIGQVKHIRAAHKKSLAVKLISGALKDNCRYSA